MSETPLAAARREAEEALRRHDTAHWSERGGEDNVYPCITALRALLAALPAEGEGKTCPGCGGLGWIPAGDEQLGCIDCNGTGEAPAPQPAPTDPLPEVPEPVTEADALIRLAYDARFGGRDWQRRAYAYLWRDGGFKPAPQPAPTTDWRAAYEREHARHSETLGILREFIGPDRDIREEMERLVALANRPSVPAPALPPEVEAAEEALWHELDEIVRDLTYATLNTRHVRTVLAFLSSASAAKGGAS